MLTDPIADLLTRLRNAQKAEKTSTFLAYSNEKKAILEILKKYHFIKNFSVEKNDLPYQELKVDLNETGKLTLRRMSKPGRRIYKKNKDLKRVKNGLGIWIISTPKGILSNVEAKKENVGGELLCEVY